MDVTISCKLVRHLPAAAALSLVVLPATWAAASGSTAIFVTDNDNPQPEVSETQVQARGSLAFVQPARVEPVINPIRETSAQSPQALRVRPQQEPIAHPVPQQVATEKKQSTSRSEPKQLTASSTGQRQQRLQAVVPPRVVRRAELYAPASQLKPVRKANHQTEKSSPPKVDPVAKILIDAHELSLQVASEEDYSGIIGKCSEALRLGAAGDKKNFARQLTSWCLNRRGQLRMDASEEISANADFQAAIDFSSNNWRALHNRGVSHAQSGELAEAFDDFNSVIELNPQYAKAYSNRATLFVKANDMQSALGDYRKASSLDPHLAAAHVGQGRVCHTLGRLEEAVEHFSRAVQVDPTNANNICSRGDLQADMGHYASALADYARTIELNPKFGHAYRNGAWLLATCPNAKFRDPENALLGARRALETGYGEQHLALDTLAAAQASAGEFEQAMDTIAQAIELAPEGAKIAYHSRMQMYQDCQPFRTEPVGNVAQAVYEVTDR